MSSRRLTTLNVRVRSGVAVARSLSVGFSCVTVGREARTNGRISSWMTGVVPRHERAHAAQRRPERSRARPQRLQRRTELVGQRVRLAEPALRRLERGRQLAQRRAQVGVLARERGEHGVRVLDELGHLVVAGAELPHQQRQVVDDALDVVLARLERAEHLAPVARGRLEAPDRARQRAPVAAQPLAAGAEQDRQVVARVGVHRREDLVEVDVRQRLAHRDRVALVQPARGAASPARARPPCPSARSWAAAARSRCGRRGCTSAASSS